MKTAEKGTPRVGLIEMIDSGWRDPQRRRSKNIIIVREKP